MFDRGRALVIGIGEYTDARKLPTAVLNDARDIADVLRSPSYGGFPAGNVRLLLNEHATLERIRGSMTELARATRPDDSVIVYFSGHGGRFGKTETCGLIPVDYSPSNPIGSALLESEFSSLLSSITAKRLLVMIDACHAGAAGVLKDDVEDDFLPGLTEKALRGFALGVGRVIIASSRADEKSRILAGARNSVFTARLLEALAGKAKTAGDGLIRVFDVFNYVAEHVKRTVPGLQHPVFQASDLEDNFPVAFARGGVKDAAAGATSELPRRLDDLMADLYPEGPTDQDIWPRSGGDVSRLKLVGSGRARWFAALRTLSLGGGGRDVSLATLIAAALEDYPRHPELLAHQADKSL